MTASIGTAPPSSTSAVLAALLVNDLDGDALAMLARRLTPHLQQLYTPAVRAAYTVESLADELEVSPKTVRCAIARGELQAVKRGSRWIISARAVDEWGECAQARADDAAWAHSQRASAGWSISAIGAVRRVPERVEN